MTQHSSISRTSTLLTTPSRPSSLHFGSTLNVVPLKSRQGNSRRCTSERFRRSLRLPGELNSKPRRELTNRSSSKHYSWPFAIDSCHRDGKALWSKLRPLLKPDLVNASRLTADDNAQYFTAKIVDQGHVGALMLMDMSAAFDTVDHTILMDVTLYSSISSQS
jgi:hypothetical protein